MICVHSNGTAFGGRFVHFGTVGPCRLSADDRCRQLALLLVVRANDDQAKEGSTTDGAGKKARRRGGF